MRKPPASIIRVGTTDVHACILQFYFQKFRLQVRFFSGFHSFKIFIFFYFSTFGVFTLFQNAVWDAKSLTITITALAVRRFLETVRLRCSDALHLPCRSEFVWKTATNSVLERFVWCIFLTTRILNICRQSVDKQCINIIITVLYYCYVSYILLFIIIYFVWWNHSHRS